MNEPKMHKYAAYGLVISSEFALPELEYGEGEANISIIVGAVPFAAEPGDLDCNYIISRDKFTFLIEDVAKYLIENGSRIVIEPCKNADLQTIKAYLLGMALGILLIQKGLVPIHGSTVAVKGKAVIFTGNSGAGKTTLCSWFQKNGYGYLADDVSAIKLDDGCMPLVQPGFSQQKICEDTAARLGVNSEKLPLASLHDAKFIMENKSLFVDRQTPLQGIVEIAEAENDYPAIRKITGMEKIHYFMKNVYCAVLYEEIGFNKDFFEHCMQIVKQIEIYQLLRPRGIYSEDAQMQLIIETLFAEG